MRILCVIDHFGSGGAQRQMVNLATGLARRGHSVELVVFHPRHDFFRATVDTAGIRVHEFAKRGRHSLAAIRGFVALLRRERYDIVLSFLMGPTLYAELGVFASRTSATLVVSERSSHHGDRWPMRAHVLRQCHRIADAVVANSHSHAAWLRRHCGWLRDKVHTIYNGVEDGDVVADASDAPPDAPGDAPLRLIAIGRVGPEKNLLTLIVALDEFHRTHGWIPAMTWVGRMDESTPEATAFSRRVTEELRSRPAVARAWTWLGERRDVPELLARHDALIHPSFYEGLPNVICEALAAGVPVLASNVCDNPLLVEDGGRGFLFEPDSPDSMVQAIERFVALDPAERARLAANARAYAREALSIDRMTLEYETLFAELLSVRER